MPTIEDIKAMIEKVGPIEYCGDLIAEGSLPTISGESVAYKLALGWDVVLANRCDETWGTFNMKLLRFIDDQKLEDKALATALQGIQIDDSHWRWLNKSLLFRTDEYKWFFLLAEGYPQAACLIYHPKPSAFDGQGIFYIEYVAVAPWNRDNPMAGRSFKGVGKTIVNHANAYAMKSLGLRPGFSLHALPKATGFYISLGMKRVEAFDKDGLPYFEMPEDTCAKWGASA